MFGYSKLDVMFGRQTLDAVRLYYRDIAKPSRRVPPGDDRVDRSRSRRVVDRSAAPTTPTCWSSRSAPISTRGATPGLVEAATSSTTEAGADRLRDVLPTFDRGDGVIGVSGRSSSARPRRSRRDDAARPPRRSAASATRRRSECEPMPNADPDLARSVRGHPRAFAERGIEFWPESVVTALDPATRPPRSRRQRASVRPLPRRPGAPRPRGRRGIRADRRRLDPGGSHDVRDTSFPDVYAVGDVTSAPVPRAGVFAEGEPRAVAEALIATAPRRRRSPTPTRDARTCYIEFGAGRSRPRRRRLPLRAGAAPASSTQPSDALVAEKHEFGSSRRARWFAPATASV